MRVFCGLLWLLYPAVTAAQRGPAVLSLSGLTAQEISLALNGTVVVKQVPAGDSRRLAFVGAVVVNVSQERMDRSMADMVSWVGGASGRSSFGLLADPASGLDVSSLVVSPAESRIVMGCRPHACALKIPRSFMAAVHSVPRGEESEFVSGLARAHVLAYAAAYKLKGQASMLDYTDLEDPRVLERVQSGLLTGYPLSDVYAPALRQYLLDFPQARISGVRDNFYWSLDSWDGLRPLTLLVHASLFPSPVAGAMVLSERQLYASHYFDGAQSVTVAERMGDNRLLLMTLRVFQFDKLPSGGLLNIRARATSKLIRGVRDELRSRKQRLEW